MLPETPVLGQLNACLGLFPSLSEQDRRKCECKNNYIGDGLNCSVMQLPLDRCLQDNGQCHPDADCADLHFQGEEGTPCTPPALCPEARGTISLLRPLPMSPWNNEITAGMCAYAPGNTRSMKQHVRAVQVGMSLRNQSVLTTFHKIHGYSYGTAGSAP